MTTTNQAPTPPSASGDATSQPTTDQPARLSFPLPPTMRPANLPNPYDMKESDIMALIHPMQQKSEQS